MSVEGDDPRHLLLRVLKEPPPGYRRWTRPADIIEQSLKERRDSLPIAPVRLADLLRKLVPLKSKD
jgi:hypothetical protein